MSSGATAKAPQSETPGVGFNLAAIALVLVLGGLALAYALDAASRAARQPTHRTDDGVTLTRTIGGKDLEIPLAWFRYAEQPAEGISRQVDLHLVLAFGPTQALHGIDVTLLPRSSLRTSARLLDDVYLHLFAEQQLSGPPGLVGKPLEGARGYASETVWYDPLTPDPFVAKCSAPVTPNAPGRCLRTVHLVPGIAAAYTFDADVLAWGREFDPRMRPLLEQIGVFAP